MFWNGVNSSRPPHSVTHYQWKSQFRNGLLCNCSPDSKVSCEIPRSETMIFVDTEFRNGMFRNCIDNEFRNRMFRNYIPPRAAALPPLCRHRWHTQLLKTSHTLHLMPSTFTTFYGVHVPHTSIFLDYYIGLL